MVKGRLLSLAAVALLSTAGSTFGQNFFSANLTVAQESGLPARVLTLDDGITPRPLSFGNAALQFTFDGLGNVSGLTMSIDIFNIDVTGNQTPNITNDNLVAAHIHGPAAPGSNASVIWGFFGAPDHDIAPSDLVVTPFAGVGGNFTTIWNVGEGAGGGLLAHVANIRNGLTYLNFHTTQNGGGEIRGQIVPTPEHGSTGLLFALAVAALLVFVRARTRLT